MTMHPLTDHWEHHTVIKVQMFPDASVAKTPRQTRTRTQAQSLYLDAVTDVRRVTTSKSHAYAFQVKAHCDLCSPQKNSCFVFFQMHLQSGMKTTFNLHCACYLFATGGVVIFA